MMFKALLLFSAAAVALAQYNHGYGDAYAHDYAQPIPYEYGYDIAGDHGEFKQTRQESGDGNGNVKGSYGYTDAHGIYRQVDYVADAHGFRAQVKTNEPGTESQNPADVELHAEPIQVPAHAYSAPAHAYAAPAHAYAAPAHAYAAPRHGYGHY